VAVTSHLRPLACPHCGGTHPAAAHHDLGTALEVADDLMRRAAEAWRYPTTAARHFNDARFWVGVSIGLVAKMRRAG
jgi:hypothetical protein